MEENRTCVDLFDIYMKMRQKGVIKEAETCSCGGERDRPQSKSNHHLDNGNYKEIP